MLFSAEMKTMNRAFSIGNCKCIGIHLAKVQLLLTACSPYQRFDIALDARTTSDLMLQRDQGLMTPINKKLWVNLRPISPLSNG